MSRSLHTDGTQCQLLLLISQSKSGHPIQIVGPWLTALIGESFTASDKNQTQAKEITKTSRD